MAESLRIVFEPQTLDALPLPGDHPTIFELLCLVRVLRTLQPEAQQIRWLDQTASENEVRIPGLECRFQHSISTSLMLATEEFDHGLREAVARHNVSIPKTIDLLFRLDHPIAGFHGLLVEAKSGTQSFQAAVHQLKCYRAAVKAEMPGRLVVWGITEADQEGWDNQQALEALTSGSYYNDQEDLWVFSSADEIEAVLSLLGLGAERIAA